MDRLAGAPNNTSEGRRVRIIWLILFLVQVSEMVF